MAFHSSVPYRNRRAAGEALAHAVRKLKLPEPRIVLALPRGGVPVAVEVARALDATLDVLIVRKIGMPWQPELAIGAIASGGIVVKEPGMARHVERLGVNFESLVERQRAELERRERTYRANAAPLNLRDHCVVLVDDGLATGATMLAAVRAVRQVGASRVVVAAPVGSREAAALLGAEADELAILATPLYLSSIGEWYEDFQQLTDDEVIEILGRARSGGPNGESP